MAELQAAGADDARTAHVERVVRGLRISGRRLVRGASGWSLVQGGGDRRRRPRLVLEDADAARLAGEGALVAVDPDTYMLAGVSVEAHPLVQPWVFISAGVRRSSSHAGYGFASLALRARKGEGPLTMRHVQAGLRMIADAERRETSHGLTMDWDAGPAGKQRRGGVAGGPRGSAMDAAKRLRRAKARVDADHWLLAWGVVVDGLSLSSAVRRFAIRREKVGAVIADALEAVALAYER